MLAFGPDGYLYIGVGDGGAGNDPPDNAQNIDVAARQDPAHRRRPRRSGRRHGLLRRRPTIRSSMRRAATRSSRYGMRNPWRFTFDRVTGVQWVADVGQGAREEVDMPIVRGGNYGWRVYEGFGCTGNDPALCDPANYRPPIFDYAHYERPLLDHRRLRLPRRSGRAAGRHVRLRRLLLRRDLRVGRHRANASCSTRRSTSRRSARTSRASSMSSISAER